MPDVIVEQLSKHFSRRGEPAVRALEQLSLNISSGELLVIVGPSGCGKTTLLRLIAGLEKATSGKIMIGGRDVTALAPKERNVAMVFQSHALYPHMTGRENLAFPLRVRKVKKNETAERVSAIARLLGIDHVMERRPAELSGGECQRIALGRALIRNPDVFLMDEPLSNLDQPLRIALRSEIKRLHGIHKWTLVYVTHDRSEALALGDRIAVMSAGKLQQVATADEIREAPANEFVRSFFGLGLTPD